MTFLNQSDRSTGRALLASASVFVSAVSAWGASPLGTAWTYQGLLRLEGANANEDCDFQFMVFDAPLDGSQIGPTLTFDGVGGNPDPVAVDNGLFTVELDFGADAFQGDERWLAIAVRCPAGVGDYQPLSPRQPILPAPEAIHARSASGVSDGPFDLKNNAIVNIGAGGSACSADGGLELGGPLDMSNNAIINIGSGGSEFTAGGDQKTRRRS